MDFSLKRKTTLSAAKEVYFDLIGDTAGFLEQIYMRLL